jgi:ABC-type antimicrobial peptide transport system permease subunit
MNIVVRGRDPEALAAQARTLILSLDPEMPPFNIRTLEDEVSRLVAGPRFSATVLAVFALTALVLAAVGVYGVMGYLAGQRTREIGMRVAVGATTAQVLRLMLRDGVFILLVGLTAGVLLSLWLTRTLTGLLHEVQPMDPATVGMVAAILAAVGLLAASLPAWRATRVSVVDALRAD